MNKMKTLVLGSVLAVSTVASSVAMAESPWMGNIGFTTNYIWRGVTQSADDAAISGGLDYNFSNGAYVGTWVSSMGIIGGLATGGEMDLYLGYGFEAGGVDLDVGYIKYMYPTSEANTGTDFGFDEVYLNASYKDFGAGLAYTTSKEDPTVTDENDLYLYVSGEFTVKQDVTLGVLFGDYDFDDPAAEDYSHYQVSVSKDDFTFAIDKNNIDDPVLDEARFTVSWAKSFDL